MRAAYYGGCTGIFASSLVWFSAAVVSLSSTTGRVIGVFFIGGMLIFPVSVLLAKVLGRSGKHSAGNPLAALAIETTFLLVLLLPVAFAVSLYRADWFFPAMLVIIGVRYLTFATLYGMKMYWALGGVLAACSLALLALHAPFSAGAFAGAAIELAFAIGAYLLNRGAGLAAQT